MTDTQLPLDLSPDPRLGRAEFLPAPSNAAGLFAVDNWRDWPEQRMLLCGPLGAGRTHLAAIWARDTGAAMLSGARLETLPAPAPAYVVDDAHLVAGHPAREEMLFHLFNRAVAARAPLLLTAPDTPGTWGLALPDLLSRMLTLAVTRIDAPDDTLLQMALVKLFDDRQVPVTPETITFLTRRLDRSLSNAERVVEALDRASLSRQKRISRVMAAQVLEDPDAFLAVTGPDAEDTDAP
ncbi:MULTISPECIES: DnaA ATPase domain-containing protein [unclassified Meridianimarinicoccus]|uniref:DnaA ATPase domain-containing protein n=1 Tax=unclassified Meridianimarinicoccus TaxID=2923344 RepID=UPI0018676734|nr:DnaA/Hda family protein [Fluviibacterium sp. MJW13]